MGRMFNLGPEERLVLSLARTDVPAEVMKDVRKTVEGGAPIDFQKVLKLAVLNQVSPLLYRNRMMLGRVTDEVIEELRGAYLHTLRKNTLHARETLRLIGLLYDAGVQSIPLKGSIASDIILKDPGLYPTSDIDLLVRPAELKKAEEVLLEAGYEKEKGFSEEDLLAGHYHLIFNNGTYVVEAHWNLVRRYFEVPPEFWWEERTETEYGGLRISQLSPERYLLYAIFHLFIHGFRPLKFSVLISELTRRYREELDWEKLLSSAERHKMTRLTIFTLRLLHELLGTDIPDTLRMRHVHGYGFLRKAVLSGLFGGVTRPHLNMLNYALLLDGPGDMARVVLGRVFPDAAELRLRFGLPENSKKIYLYYLLNPFILALRKR